MQFNNGNWGSLELIIVKTNKNYYQPDLQNNPSFNISGFELKESEYSPFFLFEWQTVQYSYIISSDNPINPPFDLIINNRIVNSSKERGDSHLLTGQFSFDDQVGETQIKFQDQKNKVLFELKTEVFPQKMDYKSDYKAMMADITQIVQNLAYESLKDTFKRSKARLRGLATQNEWWSILSALFEEMIINLGVIKRQPKHEIKNREQVLPVEKIRHISRSSRNWFQRNRQYSNNANKGIEITENKYYTHALSVKKYVTYDTYENRFIAWAVKRIIEQLKQYRMHIESHSGMQDFSPVTKKIKMYQSTLQGILHENPFDEVGVFEERSHFSTSLTRGAGYRDFMHIYLLLTRGLDLADNEIFKIEQKNISTLYEYWCFLKLVQILSEQNCSVITFQNLVKIEANKFRVNLRKGTSSEVKFEKQDTKEKSKNESTTIYFNRKFKKDNKKVYTYNQIPDYSIKFRKKGFDKPFWYLFDAKYRFDEYPEAEANMFNVPQDAIGQLHRYRDAILHSEPVNTTYRGAIKNLGGIILYPYPLSEENFRNNDFFKSIEQVNIGSLPFLPSKTSLVSDLLDELINKRMPEEHFENFIEMDHSEYLKHREKWTEWVTIGVIPKENQDERLKFLLKRKVFYVPHVKNTHSKIYLTKKILVCIAGSKKARLYDVLEWEVLDYKELKKLKTTWNHHFDKYVIFRLSNPIEITTPDKLAPRTFRYSSLEGLNQYLNNPDNDKYSFYLTNPDAARLYQELKRKEDKEFNIAWAFDNYDPSLIVFTVENKKIYSSDLFPELHFKYDDQVKSLKSVLKLLD